ncbi:MAG: hypothetical protein MUF10_00065 [Thermoanaerobaculaceae bacterium]|jgi:predicted nucleic acid-binding protein|nr:hypothetical protein [Thermoanaerobaculaceae bacterium]
MDRAFLDANVLFSAAWREHAGLLALWHLGDLELVTSEHAVEEALRNLPDDPRREKLGALLATVEVGVGAFEAVPLPAGANLPADDLPILQAALGMAATHVLTGDVRHFGHLMGKKVGRLQILRPAEYLRRRRE